MGNLRFPDNLRPVVSSGYSQTRGGNVFRTTVQGGVPRQGRDTFFEPVPIVITLILSALQRQVFYCFLNNIRGGADSFVMVHDSGLGLQDHQVYITSEVKDSTQDGKNWVISFTATAERTPIQSETCMSFVLPDLYACYGVFLLAFLKEYMVAQSTFPRIWDPMR